MHQLDQLVAEPLHERHVLIRHRDEADLDHRLVGVAPLEPGQLLVLATPGAHEVPSLVDDLPALLSSFLDDVDSVWVGIGSLAASDAVVERLASSLDVEVVAPDGGVAAMPGAALYAGHGAGGTGWYRSGEFLGARFPSPDWESWLPAAPVEVDGVVAEPAPCGLVIAEAAAFDVPVNQRFPKLVVGSPVPSPVAVAELLAGLPDRPIMLVPAAPEAATHIWQAELSMRLSRDVVFSAGMQVRTRSGALSTIVPDASGNRLFRPFPLVLQQSAQGGDQRVLDIATAPPGWEREGRRSYRHVDSAVVADVVPSGLVLRAADGALASAAAEAAPFDPEGWTLALGTSGEVVGLPVLAAAEELLTVLPAEQRAVVRVRMAGVMDEEAEQALDRWAVSRRRRSASVAEEDGPLPGRGFVVAPPEPEGGPRARRGTVVPAFEPAVSAGGLGTRLDGPVVTSAAPGGLGSGGPVVTTADAAALAGAAGGDVESVGSGSGGPAWDAAERTARIAGPVGAPVPAGSGPAVAWPEPTRPIVRPGVEPAGHRPDVPSASAPVPPVSAAGGPVRFAPPVAAAPSAAGAGAPAVPVAAPPIMTTSAAPVSTVSGPAVPVRQPEREEPGHREVAPVESPRPPVAEAVRPPVEDVAPVESPQVAVEPVRESRVVAPAGKALVVPTRGSTAGEQTRFNAAAGDAFTEALATVNAAMATWPSMRVDDSFGVKADYVAVCLFLGRGDGGARSINGALRGGQTAVLDGQLPCLMSGIRRLPTHRRAVLRQGKVNESLEHRSVPGTVLTEPGFLAGSIDLDVTVPGADLDVLIWPSTARRTSELMIGRPIDEAVFVAGARFKALAVRTAKEDDEETEDDGSPTAPRIAVLYRELAPGETPTNAELDERDLAVLAKLDSVLARRQRGQVRLVEDPEMAARLTTSMVAWQQEAAAAVAS